MTSVRLAPNAPHLMWQGIVSLEQTERWPPWRLPYKARILFPPERLQERAQMPADARLSFYTEHTEPNHSSRRK